MTTPATGSPSMRGHYIRRTWTADPTLYAPPRYRRACNYDAFVPDRLPASELIPGPVAAVIADAERAIAEVNARSGSEMAPLARLLLRSEAIASSRVEGLNMDIAAIARADARAGAGRSVGTTATEILANIDAMEIAVERASQVAAVSVDDLIQVHRALLSGSTKPSIAGRIREDQNWIGGNDYNPCGADYVPPPPEMVPALLDDLVAFCNSDDLPSVAQAAIAHAQFEMIHPFVDGNGRTGRALIQIILRRRGLAPRYVPPISVVLASNRERYINGLTSYRNGEVARWLESFSVAAARAARLAEQYSHRVKSLQDGWRARITAATSPRSDAAVWSLIAVLPSHPIVTIALGVAATGRTRPAVVNALDELASAGIVNPAGTSPRRLEWEAPEVLDLLADLDAGIA